MKLNNGFRMRHLGRDTILTETGAGQVDFNKMIVLNDSAAYLWSSVVDKDFEVEDLKNLLLEKYDVAEEIAAADSEKIVESWKEAGLLAD